MIQLFLQPYQCGVFVELSVVRTRSRIVGKYGTDGARSPHLLRDLLSDTRTHSVPIEIFKKIKYFNGDPHRIVSYGLQVENKDNLNSHIEGQSF